jgi:peptidoglycan/LPS O-acetylase OafA/YrhL
VVGFHATVLWHDRAASAVTPWENGNAGVDLFFVISGFIMVLSSRRLTGRVDGWRRFISLRLVRIVPMYWLATVAKLVAITAAPDMALHVRPTPWNIMASLLFLPSHNALGIISPVLVVGWTLSFEMLFYAVFAAALACMLEPVLVVAPAMAALALLSIVRGSDWPALTVLANPLVLEFTFGMVLAHAFVSKRLQTSRPSLFLLMGALGLLALALIPTSGNWMRVAVWGTAASVALAGGLATERWLGPYLPRWLVAIGEASYSLYLTHGFVLPVIGALVARAHLSTAAFGIVLIPTCLIGSTIAALVVYRYVEFPITEWLRQKTGDRQAVSLAAPATPI